MVKVTFPDGERDVEPYAWDVSDKSRPPRPLLDWPGWRFVETVDGKIFAVKDPD
jgi:hypothetical protein